MPLMAFVFGNQNSVGRKSSVHFLKSRWRRVSALGSVMQGSSCKHDSQMISTHGVVLMTVPCCPSKSWQFRWVTQWNWPTWYARTRTWLTNDLNWYRKIYLPHTNSGNIGLSVRDALEVTHTEAGIWDTILFGWKARHAVTFRRWCQFPKPTSTAANPLWSGIQESL
jgi:hypothetical protein